VARHDKEHQQATRQRILDTAGRRFKTDGIDGSGVATLMVRQLRGPTMLFSDSAMPMPMTMEPRSWLLAVWGLMWPTSGVQAPRCWRSHWPICVIAWSTSGTQVGGRLLRST